MDGILAVAEALQVKGLGNVRSNSDRDQRNEFLTGDEMELVSEQYNENSASDPLQIPSPSSVSLKPPRKRKRISEVRIYPQNEFSFFFWINFLSQVLNFQKKVTTIEDKLSKAGRTEASLSNQYENSVPRTVTTKPVKPAASTPKASSKATPAKATSHNSQSPSKTNLTKTADEENFRSVKDQREENTQVLPFVQVTLKETQDDDNDLASTVSTNISCVWHFNQIGEIVSLLIFITD